MHEVGFVHNDLQPSSILIHLHKSDGGYSVKLGGLSRARPIGARPMPDDPNNSQVEGLNGLYKAPEVLLSNGEDCTAASDVWSLGVTLFVLASGSFPFRTHADVINCNFNLES